MVVEMSFALRPSIVMNPIVDLPAMFYMAILFQTFGGDNYHKDNFRLSVWFNYDAAVGERNCLNGNCFHPLLVDKPQIHV